MSEIFISYARSNARAAARVADALRALGYAVWRDDELPAHRAYADVIAERLETAKAVVVLWSADAVNSQWVRSEADRARNQSKLVQLVLDGARLPMPFDQIQCADLAGWDGGGDNPGWRKVVGSLADLMGASPAARSPAAARDPVPAKADPLLAVLAFDNPSHDQEIAYFSEGVAQEILDTLARGSAVRLIGRASSFALQGEAKAPRRVAAQLSATHVLDGSVRRAGSRVRISAELCDCADGSRLWSDRFDRDLSDIFALQDEIASTVAHALKSVFASPMRHSGSVTPKAYELYLRSRAPGQRIAAKDRAELVARALELAPDFAEGWAWLALTRARQALFERGDAPFAPLEAAVREAISRCEALGLRTGLTKAAASLLEPFAAFVRREALVDEALSVTPSDPIMLLEKSRLLSTVGLLEDALVAARLAHSLDPSQLEAAARVAILTLLIGDWAAGQAACNDLRARWPTDATGGVTFAAPAAAHAGDREKLEEVARFAAAQEWGPERSGMVMTNVMFSRAVLTKDAGFANLALAVAKAELARDGAPGMEKLYALAALGRVDEAYDLAERASWAGMFEPGNAYMASGYNIDFLCATSHNRAMIEDEGFVRLCAKIGLASYWVETGRWPRCADEVAYDFRGLACQVACDGIVSPEHPRRRG